MRFREVMLSKIELPFWLFLLMLLTPSIYAVIGWIA